MSEAQAGWYPDPSGVPTRLRYWNGEQWTDEFTATPLAEEQADGGAGPSYQQAAYQQQPAYQQQLAYQQQPAYQQQQAYQQQNACPQVRPAGDESDRTMRLVAFGFCVLSIASVVLAIIPTLGLTIIALAWMIPMTIRCWGVYKGTKPNTTAYAICTLLFVSIVGGILLLVSNKDE